jgi:hypothetical protein
MVDSRRFSRFYSNRGFLWQKIKIGHCPYFFLFGLLADFEDGGGGVAQSADSIPSVTTQNRLA